MPTSLPFGQLTIGGNHSDNPPDYNWRTYDNYPGLDLTQVYLRIDVIVPAQPKDLQVTGLAVVIGGQPQTGTTAPCMLPCPPYC
jgi:hypothetical protein